MTCTGDGGRSARIEIANVARNLARVLRCCGEERVEISAALMLVAGCVDRVGGWEEKAFDELVDAAREIVGSDYAAGFIDGFDCVAAPTRSSTLRYVQGLDDGGVVGRAVRWGEVER